MPPDVLTKLERGRRVRRQSKAPKGGRDPSTTVYFPGEAARILKLKGVDYHQLRRLFRILVPDSTPGPNKKWKWSRYSFRELVGLRTALRLAQNGPRGRLDLKSVAEACRVLRSVFQIPAPLTEAQLERIGDTIVANVGGHLFDAGTGQQLIDEVARQVTHFVEDNREPQTRAACLGDVAAHRTEINEGRKRRRPLAAATSRGSR